MVLTHLPPLSLGGGFVFQVWILAIIFATNDVLVVAKVLEIRNLLEDDIVVFVFVDLV